MPKITWLCFKYLGLKTTLTLKYANAEIKTRQLQNMSHTISNKGKAAYLSLPCICISNVFKSIAICYVQNMLLFLSTHLK